MTINKMLQVKLLSDLCPASGDGFAGYVDSDVCFDGYGLPYIPGKRLKGCLRECGLDILSTDDSHSYVFYKLFGKKGQLVPGVLNIGNGRLKDYDSKVASIGGAHRSELMELYTSTRSRTKIEGGKAAPGTLRTIRVLNMDDTDYSYEFPVALTEDVEEFFKKCVGSLRAMGLNRSRGLGEIECKLVDCDSQNGVVFNPSDFMDEKVFSYTLELLEPVISAERSGKPFESEDYIFGSAILGAFAAKYIEKYIEAHGSKREEAYEDENFRRIFLDGEVKFTAAMPMRDGETYHPAPLPLKTNKLMNRLSDESGGVPAEMCENNPICKHLGGFVAKMNTAVKQFRPEKTTFIHHARPDDKSIGHADSKHGEMYSYEALSEGQTFSGSVIGHECYLDLLSGLFIDSNILRIGRSRTAQYGRVSIKPKKANIEPNAFTLKNNDEIRLVAVTPLILEDTNGINTTNIENVKRILGTDFDVVRYICAETTVAGYNGKWLLPRVQERAIAEGSVIVLKYKGTGATLSNNFIGRRTGEGFGQIKFESVPKPDELSLCTVTERSKPETTFVPEKIAALRAAKEAIAYGTEYGEKFSSSISNANLQRVITALRTANGFSALAAKLCDIRQQEQKLAALIFATGKDKWYFKKDATHFEQAHIEILLEQRDYQFDALRKYLLAAGQRVRQKKRKRSEDKRMGGEINV
jgi:CRISPR-associated protein Csx10